MLEVGVSPRHIVCGSVCDRIRSRGTHWDTPCNAEKHEIRGSHIGAHMYKMTCSTFHLELFMIK